jgi:hypothetical protein
MTDASGKGIPECEMGKLLQEWYHPDIIVLKLSSSSTLRLANSLMFMLLCPSLTLSSREGAWFHPRQKEKHGSTQVAEFELASTHT